MIVVKVMIEGLGLGFLLYLICALGIRNGAVGMVHLYSSEVQRRVVENGITTEEAIKRRSILFNAFVSPAISYMFLSVRTRSTEQEVLQVASGRCL